jgi:pimeloyl-ACP methyl ester carboxylesterase
MTVATSHSEAQHGQATTLPVIFVPGIGHTQQGWMIVRRHLERAGFRDIGVLDDSSRPADIPHLADRLAHHVEAVRLATGHQRVHLVGHNVGGVVARYYVQLLGGDAEVSSVITVAAPHSGTHATHAGWGPAAAQLRPGSAVLRHLEESTRPMPVRWVCYFSERDLFVVPTTSAMLRNPMLRATNLLVPNERHLSLVLPLSVGRSIAHQLAAMEGIPGYGRAVSGLPTIGRLGVDGDPKREAAIRRSREMHPSNWEGYGRAPRPALVAPRRPAS